MLLNDTRISANAEPYFVVGKMGNPTTTTDFTKPMCKAPDNFSDAIERSRFLRTSIHIPGKTFTLQVSNVETPNQAATSTDWVDIATTTTGFIDTDIIAKFFRVKCTGDDTASSLPDGTRIYVISIFSKY